MENNPYIGHKKVLWLSLRADGESVWGLFFLSRVLSRTQLQPTLCILNNGSRFFLIYILYTCPRCFRTEHTYVAMFKIYFLSNYVLSLHKQEAILQKP